MIKYTKIDRAVYWVDDDSKTYGFQARNPDWKDLDPRESLQNQKRLEGYTRIFKNGRTKTFRFDQSRSRKARARRLQKNQPGNG